MPNVMAALPNIGGALCSTLQVWQWLMANTGVPCSNAAETRNPLKLAGVPQTTGSISAATGPKFTILWGHEEEILLLKKVFFRLSIRVLVAKIWPDKFVRWCPDGDFFGVFLGPAFPASRVQHVSDLRSKFALGPHRMSKYGRHPFCDRWD